MNRLSINQYRTKTTSSFYNSIKTLLLLSLLLPSLTHAEADNGTNAEEIITPIFNDEVCIDTGDLERIPNTKNKECPEGTEDGDKLLLTANYYTPAYTSDTDARYPAVIFINSWVLNEDEYRIKAREFAQSGYIALSYATRGFGESDGEVTTGGPKDIKDLSTVIDWLQNNRDLPWDGENIGVAAISYGSGIGLLSLAHDTRIDAVASMSGWANLVDSLWGGQTTNLEWTGILMGLGDAIGRLEPELYEKYENLKQYKNMEETIDWAMKRSPITYLDLINNHPDRTKKPAVFISNNWNDELFQPDAMLSLFEKLEIPKIMRVNEGMHGMAEVPGLIGGDHHVWREVIRFFNHHLKNIDTGIMDEPKVSFIIKHKNKREYYEDWPLPADIRQDTTYYLGPRPSTLHHAYYKTGSLSTEENSDFEDENDVISSSRDTTASLGPIPSMKTFYESISIETAINMGSIDTRHGIVYQTEPLTEDLHIRGIPKATVWIEPNASTVSLIGYLYEVESNKKFKHGKGNIITHGPITLHNIPGAEINGTFVADASPVKADIRFNAIAYDIPAGHSLAFVIDTRDPQYQLYNKKPFKIRFVYDDQNQHQLWLPTIKSIKSGLPKKTTDDYKPNDTTSPPKANLEEADRAVNKTPNPSIEAGVFDKYLLAMILLLAWRHSRSRPELR